MAKKCGCKGKGKNNRGKGWDLSWWPWSICPYQEVQWIGRKMPKDTRCKISLNHSKSNLLKINDEVGSIRYWALKIGKAHSVLSYRLKVHGIDNLRKYIEQRIKLV